MSDKFCRAPIQSGPSSLESPVVTSGFVSVTGGTAGDAPTFPAGKPCPHCGSTCTFHDPCLCCGVCKTCGMSHPWSGFSQPLLPLQPLPIPYPGWTISRGGSGGNQTVANVGTLS